MGGHGWQAKAVKRSLEACQLLQHRPMHLKQQQLLSSLASAPWSQPADRAVELVSFTSFIICN